MVVLVLLLCTANMLLVQVHAGRPALDPASLTLLQRVVKDHPGFLDIPYEDIVRFMALEKAGVKTLHGVGAAGKEAIGGDGGAGMGIADSSSHVQGGKPVAGGPKAKSAARSSPGVDPAKLESSNKKRKGGDDDEEIVVQRASSGKGKTEAKKESKTKKSKEQEIAQQKKKQEQEKQEREIDTDVLPTDGSFVGMPLGSGNQFGQCDKVLSNQADLQWIQGSTNMTTGAMTLIYFMAQECTSCHEVAVKINNIYKQWRHRGLNVVAIHSSPKGYASTEEDMDSLREFIQQEGIEFAVADLAAKDGEQPMLRSGLPDWKRAARLPTKLDSFYRYLFDEMEYVVPLAMIYKNCVPLMSDPLEGYHIMALDRSIASSQDMMLWPYGQLSDDTVQLAGFEDAANAHGMSKEELELEWDGDVAAESGALASDPYEKLKKEMKEAANERSGKAGADRAAAEAASKGKRTRKGRQKKEKHRKIEETTTTGRSGDSGSGKSKSRQAATGIDPRDDDSAIIYGVSDDYDDSDTDQADEGSDRDDFPVFDQDEAEEEEGRSRGSGSGASSRKQRLAAKKNAFAEEEEEEEEEEEAVPRRKGGLKRRRGGSFV